MTTPPFLLPAELNPDPAFRLAQTLLPGAKSEPTTTARGKIHFKIPRFLKVTNRLEDNDLDQVKFKLRKNAIDHLHFNPSFENAEGQRYFSRVYVPNQHEFVPHLVDMDLADLSADDLPDKNLYDFIIERGFKNMIGKGTGVTCMRTGYNPGKLRRQYLEIKREKRLSDQGIIL